MEEIIRPALEVFKFAAAFYSVSWVVDQLRRKKILVLEDCPSDQLILKKYLDGKKCNYTICKNFEEARNALTFPFFQHDGAIIDYSLPTHNGDKFYQLCQSESIDAIMITGADKIEGIPDKNIIKKGSQDYFDKLNSWLNEMVRIEG